MLVVPVDKGNNIEKALRKFKRKFEKVGIAKELRRRRTYIKPSVRERMQRLKAIYIQQTYGGKA